MELPRRKFGVGPDVSLFTLGTMRALESPDQMHRVIKAAFHAGINHLETAPSYGPAESFIGAALKKLKEEEKLAKRNNLVISAAALSAVSVFGIIMTL